MDANKNIIPIVEDDQGEGFMDPWELEDKLRAELLKKEHRESRKGWKSLNRKGDRKEQKMTDAWVTLKSKMEAMEQDINTPKPCTSMIDLQDHLAIGYSTLLKLSQEVLAAFRAVEQEWKRQEDGCGWGQEMAIRVLQACYRKHHCGDESIGWDELSNMIGDALWNAMGGEEYNKWLEKNLEEENVLIK